jgi:hypothetical protein
MPTSFSANYTDVGDAIVLTISSDVFELNVALRIHELARLDHVLATPWQGGALQLGECANSAAWWSCDEGNVAIGVGHDDQLCDFSISFPVSEFTKLRESIDGELAKWDRG